MTDTEIKLQCPSCQQLFREMKTDGMERVECPLCGWMQYDRDKKEWQLCEAPENDRPPCDVEPEPVIIPPEPAPLADEDPTESKNTSQDLNQEKSTPADVQHVEVKRKRKYDLLFIEIEV